MAHMASSAGTTSFPLKPSTQRTLPQPIVSSLSRASSSHSAATSHTAVAPPSPEDTSNQDTNSLSPGQWGFNPPPEWTFPGARGFPHRGDETGDAQVRSSATSFSPDSATPGSYRANASGFRKRLARTNTFRSIEEFEEERGWRPGASTSTKPGVDDPSKPDGGNNVRCQITVFDFSPDHLAVHELDNERLIAFLQLPQPAWVRCRWISVNGLSWDVMQALARYKNLHRLAIHDIMSPFNRTKADWYPTYAFMILTCQKLVRMTDADDDDGDDDADERDNGSSPGIKGRLKRWWANKRKRDVAAARVLEAGGPGSNGSNTDNGSNTEKEGVSDASNPSILCTLQSYRASNNGPRTKYMEKHSALSARGLAVTAEQAALFVTADNTVISLFEQSADDVEAPLLARLSSADTVLRQACDASLVGQAIIDAVVDMADPVAACYAEVVADMEVEALTRPRTKQTKDLYIVASEIDKIFSFVGPIRSLIQALRDHTTTPTTTTPPTLPTQGVSEAGKGEAPTMSDNRGAIISPLTRTYLEHLLDHCAGVAERLSRTKESATGLTNYVVDAASSQVNASMRRITMVAIIYLPLNLATGYYGMNIQFADRNLEVKDFWYIAIPALVITILWLSGEWVSEWIAGPYSQWKRKRTNGGRRRRRREVRARA